jgi:ATP-dependent DNA ligase
MVLCRTGMSLPSDFPNWLVALLSSLATLAITTLTEPFKIKIANLPERKSQHQHAISDDVMKQVQWLKPEQPAEIEFVERTPHGRLRHATFRRLLPRSGEK